MSNDDNTSFAGSSLAMRTNFPKEKSVAGKRMMKSFPTYSGKGGAFPSFGSFLDGAALLGILPVLVNPPLMGFPVTAG